MMLVTVAAYDGDVELYNKLDRMLKLRVGLEHVNGDNK